jgi:hypothetical protein
MVRLGPHMANLYATMFAFSVIKCAIGLASVGLGTQNHPNCNKVSAVVTTCCLIAFYVTGWLLSDWVHELQQGFSCGPLDTSGYTVILIGVI